MRQHGCNAVRLVSRKQAGRCAVSQAAENLLGGHVASTSWREVISLEYPRRMLKKALQHGRSKRRGESYSLRYVEPLRAARTPLVEFFSILSVCRTNLRYSPYITGRMTVVSDSFERQEKGIQLEYNQTHGRMSCVCPGRRADPVLREGARGIRRRVLRRVTKRWFLGEHGQPRITHLSGQWREADRTIDDG